MKLPAPTEIDILRQGVHFTIPRVVACARPRATLARHPRTRKLLLNKNGEPFIRVYTDHKTERFKGEVRLIAGAAIRQPLAGYWASAITVYTRDRRVIDLDNIVKAVVDGIVNCGKVPDDHRLWRYPLIERILTAREERIEVEVSEMTPQVDDAIQLDKSTKNEERNCATCLHHNKGIDEYPCSVCTGGRLCTRWASARAALEGKP